MGVHVIRMPDIGEGIAEVELVGWHVKPGDTVKEDQTLADVMTDKANVEIPSPVSGRVLALGGEVGQVLPVGSELIRLEVEGAGNAVASPVAEAPAQEPVSAARQREQAASVAPPASMRPRLQEPGVAVEERPIASPAVRRRAWELGLDLVGVPGTGPGGRIMQADLDAWAARHPPTSPPREPEPEPEPVAPPDDTQDIRVIGLRRKIAQRMQDAKRRIPHFTYVEEIDVTELEALRARLNERWAGQRPHLTLLPFLVRAMVLGVREHPHLNARFDDEAGVVTRHAAVHIGMATQTGAGLMVPVLRHAESRDLWGNAAEMTRLADAARSGRATRDELAGSTITITSLGALGGIASTPVINAPEVAIVGVNRIVERPAMLRGAMVPRKMMNLSSSFDHRVVDGRHAAEFVQSLRARVECPATLFVE